MLGGTVKTSAPFNIDSFKCVVFLILATRSFVLEFKLLIIFFVSEIEITFEKPQSSVFPRIKLK